jgi:hypothetical protein
MLADLDQLLAAADRVYPAGSPIKALAMLAAARRVKAGEELKAVAKDIGTTAKALGAVVDAPDPVQAALGCELGAARQDEKLMRRVRQSLGQLLVGHLAEREFETIYRKEMGTDQLRLEDDRSARNDTDYRVLNGGGRRVFRINIKFFGSKFRNAKELVGLDPEDCFALATYKIKQGLDKQHQEVLPYLFVIVGVPELTGERAGTAIPEDLQDICAVVHKAPKATGKRGIEDAIIDHVMATPDPKVREAIAGFAEQVSKADWYVLSARRADALLRRLLFERVYAVKVRAFARNYPNAELDMHFSLAQDLTPLRRFLAIVREDGLHKMLGLLERGDL